MPSVVSETIFRNARRAASSYFEAPARARPPLPASHLRIHHDDDRRRRRTYVEPRALLFRALVQARRGKIRRLFFSSPRTSFHRTALESQARADREG